MIANGSFVYCRSTKKFLFLLRNSPGRFQYTWNLPGGGQESGESVRDCLIREINEETGMSIMSSYVPVDSYTNENGNFVYNTFFCSVDKEFTPWLNEEHCGYCWLPLDQFPRPMHPGVFNSIREEDTKAILLTLMDGVT